MTCEILPVVSVAVITAAIEIFYTNIVCKRFIHSAEGLVYWNLQKKQNLTRFSIQYIRRWMFYLVDLKRKTQLHQNESSAGPFNL